MKFILPLLLVLVFISACSNLDPRYTENQKFCLADSDCTIITTCCNTKAGNKHWDYATNDEICMLIDCVPNEYPEITGTECIDNECVLIFEVNNFEDCVAAGNPIMESYPEKCMHNGETFVKDIKEYCPDERPEVCTKEYRPVCGYVQVECITTPCDPVPQTFSNGCTACSNERVEYYEPGECT